MLIFGYVVDYTITDVYIGYMDIDGFHYKLWCISFPIDPIDLKLTECTDMAEVNVYTKLED